MFLTDQRVKRICEELAEYMHPDSEKILSYKMKEGNFKGGEAPGLDTTGWESFHPEQRWGGLDKHYWFRTEVKIPDRFENQTVIYELTTGREKDWDATNPQFLVYVNGELVQGLDVNHRDIILCEKARAGEVYAIALHAYSGMEAGLVELNSQLSVLDREVEKLYYNIKVPLDVATLLGEEDERRFKTLNFLNEAVNILDLRKPFSESYHVSVREANQFLETAFYEEYCGESNAIAHCVGHTHIDVAWKWALAQTREKVVRSFSTVLNLMKQYPEYRFMSSQPQLYKFIKEDQPEVYKAIKQSVAEGKWEPEGGMWLEADCNLASGESLVRQVMFGKRFFQQEFGIDNRILWLPDVFGYSAALPQILRKSGIDYFMTTKISWNEYNKMPYDTFMWHGIDGTDILTHFITTCDFAEAEEDHRTTYNGDLIPSQVMGTWRRYQQKSLNDNVLISYGHGDGGGGPTKGMLENARRMEKGIPGCPKVKMGHSLAFFEELETKVAKNPKFPKWVGELYLEYHRGTYTSMARNKKYNRKSELMYQDAEWLSVLNKYAAQAGQYPGGQLNEGWETILLNQFHDILPGSSIKEVYEDSLEQYIKVVEDGQQLIDSASDSIVERIDLKHTSVVVFNPLGYDRSDVVTFELPDGYDDAEVYDEDGRKLAVQIVEDGKGIFFAEQVPAKGYKSFRLEKAARREQAEPIAVDRGNLANRFFDIQLDENANIVSIFDKVNNRQVLQKGMRGNVLQAFEDKPITYDAWDINLYYQEKMWEINDVQSIEVVENGPVRACLKIERSFLDSTIVQKLYIYHDLPRIDFDNIIDWKEKQILLKTAFPVDIHTDKAAYDIQYGNVERPTHWNTSWDTARFEVCAHKWADLSEDGYGVSLMNDCKYGYDIKDGVMRLTLLKSAVEPNPDADREIHSFTYSLYPHAEDWKRAGTVSMAYALNCPMYAKVEKAHEGTLPAALSFVQTDQENVVIEVVKKAEDSDEIIVRLYECYNRRSTANLTFFKTLAGAWECDLMENNISEIDFHPHGFEFEIKPYEIKTFKVKVSG